ncbi:annexin D5-like isoform X2 [Macadamia integrifolia]|uniref:annexin D5-like isoform X2 n=1 Tax=Macadamia integrifolia TaxID=60698 RepID=UPI001C4FDA79|nr:annexin D5-like isoform X2 [Macadamia integrifolia]
MSTLTVPATSPSPLEDAIKLYQAFKGFSCDKGEVVNILAHRDATQRALIQQEYRTTYSEDLMERLSADLSGDIKKAVLLWMHDPAGRDAEILREALHGYIDMQAVIEVICSRAPSQIQQLKQVYHSKFGDLEQDIECKASGALKELLRAYISVTRNEGPEVDRMLAEKDAEALFDAGEKDSGTNKKPFIQIFSERSRAQLATTNLLYHRMFSLLQAIKKETSGNFEFALLTIIRCAENPSKYFAKALYKAMKGLGTDEKTLTRIVVTRTESDMQFIKALYQKKYGKTLVHAVHSDTWGHYRTFLLSLLGPDQ